MNSVALSRDTRLASAEHCGYSTQRPSDRAMVLGRVQESSSNAWSACHRVEVYGQGFGELEQTLTILSVLGVLDIEHNGSWHAREVLGALRVLGMLGRSSG